MEQAPQDARCYICLDGDDATGKLLRGCACRGDSAGFVHLECLRELAMSKEASGDREAAFSSWTSCGNCKQGFTGALALEMQRRFWRLHRSGLDLKLRYQSSRSLVGFLAVHDEYDAANQLLDTALTCVGNDKQSLLDLKLLRARLQTENGQKLEALGLLQAVLPEAKAHTDHHLNLQANFDISKLFADLDRNQEAHEAAAEAVTCAKENFGLEHALTLSAMKLYGYICTKVDRVEEAHAIFKEIVTTETRILGRDHPMTQTTLECMRVYGCA